MVSKVSRLHLCLVHQLQLPADFTFTTAVRRTSVSVCKPKSKILNLVIPPSYVLFSPYQGNDWGLVKTLRDQTS